MAKKKRARPGAPGRPSGAQPTATTSRAGADIRARGGRSPDDVASPSVAKPIPASPGGPNRLARKEEARRQREQIHKKMSRRRLLRRVAVVLAVVLVGLGIGAYVVLRPTPATVAGCGSVQNVPQYQPSTDDRAHIGTTASVPTSPPLSKYPTQPPTSGPHNPTPLHAGVYDSPPDIYMAIHSLEHSAVIVWYRPTATGEALTELKTFFQENPQDITKVIIAPYSYPAQGAAGVFPAGKNMVLVAWHRMQSCDSVSLAAAQAFIGSYRYDPAHPGNYKGDGPTEERTVGI